MADATTPSLEDVVARIGHANEFARAEALRSLDAKTKPRGSLGRLEELAAQIAAIRGDVPRTLRPAIVVAAGDHGVAAHGVSAYPQEVTAQMVENIAGGGAAVSVLARAFRAGLVVVDAGVAVDVRAPNVVPLRFGAGTHDMTRGPALERAQAERAVVGGIELAEQLAADCVDVVVLGEMGIGNTTAASALTAALLDRDPASVCGRGTGLDEEGLARKCAAVATALDVNRPRASDPLGVLAAVGGFEIAVLVGVALGAAAARIVVVLDGFISSAAGLVAARLAPAAAGTFIAAHRSAEPGHQLVLDALELEPVLDLRLRLGEGTGAALVLPLLRAAVALFHEMATFADAGVTDAGR